VKGIETPDGGRHLTARLRLALQGACQDLDEHKTRRIRKPHVSPQRCNASGERCGWHSVPIWDSGPAAAARNLACGATAP